MVRIIYPLGIGVVLVAGSLLYARLCSLCVLESGTLNSASRVASADTRFIKDDFRLQTTDSEGYYAAFTGGVVFNLHSAVPKALPGAGWTDYLLEIASYLEAHPERELTITGLSLPLETNTSPFSDLGLARARAARKLMLEQASLPLSRVRLESVLVDSLDLPDNTLKSTIRLDFTPIEDRSRQMDSLRRVFSSKPLTLPYLYEDSPVLMEEEQKHMLTALIDCLDYYPELGCQVVGFTDSRGSASINFQFGKRRADFVRKYLIGLGVSTDRIESSSKGERNPVQSNLTPEGKAANRRVEITLVRIRKP